MDILAAAQENFAISISVAFGIGLAQGIILARGIQQRFPRFKIHARLASAILLVLLVINMTTAISNFADPAKIPQKSFEIPETPQEGLDAVISILGLNAGFGAVITTLTSVILLILFRMSAVHRIARGFIIAVNAIVLGAVLLARFTDYEPSVLEVILYATYQLALTVGLVLVTSKK